jgi:dienelactone hydrolase
MRTVRLKSAACRAILGCGLSVGCFYCHVAKSAESVDLAVETDGFAARYYDVATNDTPVGIVVLGGSEGGYPNRRAKAFANEGFPVLSLAYFKTPGTPDYLDEIPLEYFDKPIKWFSSQPPMDGRRIVLCGGSKGGELALLLASRRQDIAGVIAVSPSSVVFQGLPKIFWPPRSSWSWKGKPVPFVPYDISRGINKQNLRPMYEQSLSHEMVVAQAAIPVERIQGPILLITGEDDTMWPASDMARRITTRLKDHEFPHTVQHIKYVEAGHTLNEYFMLGGTKSGNAKARIDSWKKINQFISQLRSEALV